MRKLMLVLLTAAVCVAGFYLWARAHPGSGTETRYQTEKVDNSLETQEDTEKDLVIHEERQPAHPATQSNLERAGSFANFERRMDQIILDTNP